MACGDCHSVKVPRNDSGLVPLSSERTKRLRRHLVMLLFASQAAPNAASPKLPERPELSAHKARVTSSACALCNGTCCKNGEDEAFLDMGAIMRVRRANPELPAEEVIQLYVRQLPELVNEGSCIFHGARGCTLDRSLRSDLCNGYFCPSLNAYLKSDALDGPIMIVAGEGQFSRASPVLTPRDASDAGDAPGATA
jgi:hypothetical protein